MNNNYPIVSHLLLNKDKCGCMKKIILLAALVAYATNSYSNEDVDKAIAFLKMACVAEGEKLTVEADGSAGFTISRIKDAGLSGSIKIKNESVSGLVDSYANSLSNAESVRDCMKPHIEKIMSIWGSPDKPLATESADTSATEKSATASGASSGTSCAAYAGPSAASSTCSSKEKGSTSTFSGENSSNSGSAGLK